MTALIICGITCLSIIMSVFLFPKITIRTVSIDSFWVVSVLGMMILVFTQKADISSIVSALVANTSINPIKILILFISMTIMSIFLDEMGFFSYLANEAMKLAYTNQKKLFLYLYLIVSFLTIFTSNDIIILSFTPFICYFAKNAKIDPIPYLFAEFVAANTWSMFFVIGNPTNIYLATAYKIDFISYAQTMMLPTLVSGITAFSFLWFVFNKKLSEPIFPTILAVKIKDKANLIIGIVHLAICTTILAIGSYIGAEMWIVALVSVVSLFVSVSLSGIVRGRKSVELLTCIKRAPWQLVPFVISMFIMILVLTDIGVTDSIAKIFGEDRTIIKYGFSSFLAANIINNIPMSVLYSSIIENLSVTQQEYAVYSAIIGSNISAFLTPIGALAGIMWVSILKKHGMKFDYFDFFKIGAIISIPSLMSALLMLKIIY